MKIRILQNSMLVLMVSTIALLFTACDRTTAYSESISIPSDGWAKEHSLVFTPQIKDNAKTYNVYFWVRHTKGYKYSNIWVKLQSDPNFVNDTTGLLEIPIADQAGMWLGDCSQSMCTAKMLLKENYRFENTGAFKVEVTQYMREDILKEVKNIGLEFELVE
ncbi:MAG: gliding motility lipoprotein GldH [Chitinophagales bacterium]